MQYCPECGADLHERWASACFGCGADLTAYHAARGREEATGKPVADGSAPDGPATDGPALDGPGRDESPLAPDPPGPAVDGPNRERPTEPRDDANVPGDTETARSAPGPTPVEDPTGHAGTAGDRGATGGDLRAAEATGGKSGLGAGDRRRTLPFERGAAVGGATVLGTYLLTYLGFVADRLLRGAGGPGAFGPTNATTLTVGGPEVEVAVWTLVGWLLYGGMNVPLVATDGANVALFGLPAVAGAVTPLLYAGIVTLATVAAGVAVAAGLHGGRRATTVESAGAGATVALGFVPVALVGTLVVEASNAGPALGATAAYATGFAAVGGGVGGLLARTIGLAGG